VACAPRSLTVGICACGQQTLPDGRGSVPRRIHDHQPAGKVGIVMSVSEWSASRNEPGGHTPIEVASCHNEAKVTSRFTSRLATLLLLTLAVFGVGGGGFAAFAVARVAQVAAAGSTDRERREPHRVSEQRTAPLSPSEPSRRESPRHDQQFHGIFPGCELFQRPPPPLQLSYA
jgi:hypothetical protein